MSNSIYSDEENEEDNFLVATFVDLSDNDCIYVAWNYAEKQAYLYSDLDAHRQWLRRNYTVRDTIKLGRGIGHEHEQFRVEDAYLYHTERFNRNGACEIEILRDAQVTVLLNRKWDDYIPNHIRVGFKVRKI